MKITLIITGVGLIGWFLASILSVFLSCRPFYYTWDKTIPNGHCTDQNNLAYATTSASLVADLVLFIIPIPPLMKLQKSLPQRLSLIAVFLVGAMYVVFIFLISHLKHREY